MIKACHKTKLTILLASFLFLRIVIFSPGVASSPTDTDTRLIAHAGLHTPSVSPNTMDAFEKAYQYGYKTIETDLRLTEDGHWVMMHDETVDRYTDGDGFVKNHTLAEIKALRVDHGQPGDVPQLEEVLLFAKEKRINFILEVKTADASAGQLKELLALIQDHRLTHNVIIGSFHLKILDIIQHLNQEIRTMFITGEIGRDIPRIATRHDVAIDSAIFAEALQKNLIFEKGVYVYAVNSKNYRFFMNSEVKGLIYDQY